MILIMIITQCRLSSSPSDAASNNTKIHHRDS